MKKISFLITLALLTSGFISAKAQDDKQAEFERKWYDSCQTKKDDQCIPLSNELLEKYSSSQYAKYAKQKIESQKLGAAQQKFQGALQGYYGAPDSAKLDQLFTAGEDFLKVQPNQQYVIGQLALAGANASMSKTYENMNRVKSYSEQALKAFEPTAAPEGWTPADWGALRELVQAQINQYLGYYLVETKGDPTEALNYLNKSTQVKSSTGAGWKDPNNYWLRAQIYSKQYDDLRAKYSALTDEQKTGEEGKALLKQVNELLDTKLIPEYARVVATSSKPEAKPLNDAAKQLFTSFWDYRTGNAAAGTAYIKNFEADPTIAAPTVPAKADSGGDLNAPASPSTGGPVKLSSGAPSMAPGGKGATTTATNGASTTKSKAAPAKKGRRRN